MVLFGRRRPRDPAPTTTTTGLPSQVVPSPPSRSCAAPQPVRALSAWSWLLVVSAVAVGALLAVPTVPIVTDADADAGIGIGAARKVLDAEESVPRLVGQVEEKTRRWRIS